ENDHNVGIWCREYIAFSYRYNLEIQHIQSMLPFKDKIIKLQTDFINDIKSANNFSYASEMSHLLEYMEYIFSFESDDGIMLGQDYLRKSVSEANEKIQREIKKNNNIFSFVFFIVIILVMKFIGIF
ncbi:MAG: hypothetical protein K0S80_3696, partial [Neobacillus sp.]|nr:hypothetical protein [Neobacillus sp.]